MIAPGVTGRRVSGILSCSTMAGMTEQSPSDGVAGAGAPQGVDAPLFGPDEIRRIWREHRRWIAAILLAHKPREVEVEDLLQVVAIAVVRKIGELRDPGAVRPWLRTVAINAARAAGRDVKRTRKHLRLVRDRSAEPASGGGADPTGECSSRREEAEQLMALARTLPEGYREPLLMRCVRGMSYKQISAVLDLPETTIETRIARGRRMLRELAKNRSGRGDAELRTTGAGALGRARVSEKS